MQYIYPEIGVIWCDDAGSKLYYMYSGGKYS
jgi:hypothetical protein